VVDDLGAAKRLSTEFARAYGARDDWSQVTPLCDVVAQRLARTASDDITVFKAMGMGVSDLALGLRLYALASQAGLGAPLPQPRREPPRLD
jgi:ornithine cyclodeaminase